MGRFNPLEKLTGWLRKRLNIVSPSPHMTPEEIVELGQLCNEALRKGLEIGQKAEEDFIKETGRTPEEGECFAEFAMRVISEEDPQCFADFIPHEDEEGGGTND